MNNTHQTDKRIAPEGPPGRDPLRKAISALARIHSGESRERYATCAEVIPVLINAIVLADGCPDERELEAVGEHLERYFGKRFAVCLKPEDIGKAGSYAARLDFLALDQKLSLVKGLVETAYANGDYHPQERDVLRTITDALGLDACSLAAIEDEIAERTGQEWKNAESKTGLIAVGSIILVFILTATFLKAIIFGLILAYFVIPLQEWYLKRLLPSPLVKALLKTASMATLPLKALRRAKRRKGHPAQRRNGSDSPDGADREAKRLLELSCVLTVVTVVAALIFAMLTISVISTSYAANLAEKAWEWVDKNSLEEADKPVAIITQETGGATHAPSVERRALVLLFKLENKLDQIKPNWREIPVFPMVEDRITKTINEPESLKGFLLYLLSKSGGLFSYTASAIEKFFSFLIDLALAFFSFAFFLSKMASFNSKAKSDASGAEHIVNGIFNSGWFPNATEATRQSAREILGNILLRLRTWVRGYLFTIIIESAIYMVCFLLLGVPYWHILGLLAGMTILLPYIGPIASGLLTLTVCLSFGEGSSVQFTLIILVYILVHYMLEQFYLNPKLIGGSIGLNALETIMVVLLGGLFAGIPGLILAVPVASILKYLIPKIYGCWLPARR